MLREKKSYITCCYHPGDDSGWVKVGISLLGNKSIIFPLWKRVHVSGADTKEGDVALDCDRHF